MFYYFYDKEAAILDCKFLIGPYYETRGGQFTGMSWHNIIVIVEVFRVTLGWNIVFNKKFIGKDVAYESYHKRIRHEKDN